MPETGVSSMAWTGFGAALLGGGGLLFMGSRRRKPGLRRH
ncbi:LPXTG cell wall anchor domain-containing protein [Actinospica durhamensis]